MPYHTYYMVESTSSWQTFQEHQYPSILELHLIVCLVAGSQLGVCCMHRLWVRRISDNITVDLQDERLITSWGDFGVGRNPWGAIAS